MDTLLYLLYGQLPEYHLELSYSVSSAVRLHDKSRPLRIVLVTEAENRRDDLPVEHLIYTANDFAEWTSNGRFNHAAKVGAFRWALECFGGRIALVDTDTYFLADPSEIFERIGADGAIMHELEGSLADQGGYWDLIVSQYPKRPFKDYDIHFTSPMYNSGVIGASATMRDCLADVAPYMKRLNEIDPSVHNVEQFTFGDVIRRHSTISECKDLVRHYYGYSRHFVHCRIKQRFPTFSKEQFQQSLQDSRPIEGFPPKGFIDRILAKAKKVERRESNIYGFAYLAYLRSFAEPRPDFANAWSAVAIDAIRWNRFSSRTVVKDFDKMLPNNLGNYAWLKKDTAETWRAYWQAMRSDPLDEGSSKGIGE